MVKTQAMQSRTGTIVNRGNQQFESSVPCSENPVIQKCDIGVDDIGVDDQGVDDIGVDDI